MSVLVRIVDEASKRIKYVFVPLASTPSSRTVDIADAPVKIPLSPRKTFVALGTTMVVVAILLCHPAKDKSGPSI